MPHFVLDCSASIPIRKPPQEILQAVHDAAEATGLFGAGDIKVRLRPFQDYIAKNGQADFVHVFGNIMEGRTTKQKADLSRRIVTVLKAMFPDVPVISINIREFEKATYCNRDMI